MDKILVLTHEIDHENRAINRRLRKLPKGDTLHAMYKYLDCDMVDVAAFTVKGRKYDVWFDDEYMLRAGAKVPTFLLVDSLTPIMGNILFAKSDEDGKMVGLDEEDIRILTRYIDKNFIALKAFMNGFMRRLMEAENERGE